jgi:hypothetical protein
MHDLRSSVLPETGSLVRTQTLSSEACCRNTRAALARCLSSAFSSGIWSATPMPVGCQDDPDSAHGVIHGLGRDAIVVAASRVGSDGEGDGDAVVGCVIGTVLDRSTIRKYGLQPYGARPGDGLLAFIGVAPEAQGSRVISQDGDTAMLTRGRAPERSLSLARLLFEGWIDTTRVQRCPRVFVRTRRRLRPIQYLSESCGFEFCGKFDMTFRGEQQSRLVYRLDNAEAKPARRSANSYGYAGEGSQWQPPAF